MELGKEQDIRLYNLDILDPDGVSSSSLSIGLYYSLERRLESIPLDWYEGLYEKVTKKINDRIGGL